MATKLPYVNTPGTMVKILNKAKEAQTPDRFNNDFLETVLSFKGGTARQFIPLAKKLGLLNSDATPSDLYKKFRNDQSTKVAMAQALKNGYQEIFRKNEYAYKLKKDEFEGLVVEITGLKQRDKIVQLICQTFYALKTIADFESKPSEPPPDDDSKGKGGVNDIGDIKDFGLNLSYTINLVLPKTDDPAVFTAIFRSLRDNLLRK